MKGQILSNKAVEDFEKYLYKEEKSENTIQKYLHDVQAFMMFAGENEITKEAVIAYKNKLINEHYAVRSIYIFPGIDNCLAFIRTKNDLLTKARYINSALRVVDKFKGIHICIVQLERIRIDKKSNLTFFSE